MHTEPPAQRQVMTVSFGRLLVGLIAFLTLVDLFAAQAILPMLAASYAVDPAQMGLAVNASTLGMAIGSLFIACLSSRVDRRIGIVGSLTLLSVPTSLLAVAPDLVSFALLRIMQGLCMSAAFTLTLAYLGEHFADGRAAGLFAAYVTGNVASNLVGRLISAAVTDHLGLSANFLMLAGLNLAGAGLVALAIERGSGMRGAAPSLRNSLRVVTGQCRRPALLASFVIGFCILFAFIGVFSYVNFVLVAPPLDLGMMSVGFVYFVFLPSIVTTPLAGRATSRLGSRGTIWASLGLAIAGLPLLLVASLPAVLAGLTLVGVGTFFAQATATGFVGRAAKPEERGAAGGVYLASYFLGGLVGSAVLGRAFVEFGWAACVAGVGIALAAACLAAVRLAAQPQTEREAAPARAGAAAGTAKV
jgi:predicted MFS family arabinose efflux permease